MVFFQNFPLYFFFLPFPPISANTLVFTPVSQLAGATRCEPDGDLERVASMAAAAAAAKMMHVVAYCSVGYRSSQLAAQLMARHPDLRISNLEGGLFQWASEGRPMVCGAHPAHHVHPFDRAWGLLLPSHMRSYAPVAPGGEPTTAPPSSSCALA